MADRSDVAMMTALLSVQRARRDAAADRLSEATAAEQAARAEEAAAQGRTVAAEEEWGAWVGRSGFCPDMARALSARLIDRVREADAAEVRAQVTAELRDRREQDWRETEARLRLGDERLRSIRRNQSRRTEEKRLSALADRVSWAWVRT